MIQSALAIGLSLALLVGVLVLASVLGSHLSLDAEVRRKIVHVSLGLYALSFPLIFSEPWEVAVLCALAVALLMGVRYSPRLSASLGSALHAVRRESVGDLLFAVSIALLFFLSRGQDVLYVLPLLVLALCDAFAALVGGSYGRISFVVEQGRKSVEGSVVFFLTAWILAMICLLSLTALSRSEVIVASFIIAAVGTLLEGVSWKGLDNLFIPFGLFLLTEKIIETPFWGLVSMSAAFLAALVLGAWLSLRAAQHVHAAVTIVATLFFCWMAAGWAAVVAPAAVFVAYLYLRSREGSGVGEGSELPLAFCLISTAMSWYVIAQIFDIGTYDAFNLSFGLHLVALVVVRDGRGTLARLSVALAAGWLVTNLGLLFVPEAGVPDLQRAFLSLSLIFAASIAGTAGRAWLSQNRWTKQAVLAVLAAVPALAIAQ